MGFKITLKGKPRRIISLVPSQTELLHALGLEEEVVGITNFCVHPDSWLETKTLIGGTKKFKIKAIHDLKPDLIIGSKEENNKEQIMELKKHYPVWMSDVNDLEDAINMIQSIGQLTKKTYKADALAQTI